MTWYPSKVKLLSEARMYTNLQMSKVSMGDLWLGKSTNLSEKTQNPVSIWLDKFRAEYALEQESWGNGEEEEE